MKLIKISASGLPLFGKTCELNFLATQRVSADSADKLYCLFSNSSQSFYLNNVLAFIGINASGKTTVLKLITFIGKLLNNENINSIPENVILDDLREGQEVVFNTIFYAENNIYSLQTIVAREKNRFVIKDEYLKTKPAKKVKNKSDIYNFDGVEPLYKRDKNETFLLEDLSIIIAFNKKLKASMISVTDMLQYTNINQLSITEDCPPELIEFFDPSVEYLHVNRNNKDIDICLKFKGKDEIVLNQFSELNRYLSSGTIKGINIFLNAIKTFKNGGYLIVDELENHFNHEIVSTLIRFYFDKKINANGAVMIFSTHYAELIDELERNDSVYVVRNQSGITADDLTSMLIRNDIKKSEAYQSGLLEGTVPMYDAYMNLKNSIIRSHKGD